MVFFDRRWMASTVSRGNLAPSAKDNTRSQGQTDRFAMKNVVSVLAALVLLHFAGCRAGESPRRSSSVDTVLVVLGNEPLDDDTPTINMVARVGAAAGFQKEHPDTVLVFTGGATSGTNTEVRMMADLAVSQGVSTNLIRLEEEARSTRENARLTAKTDSGHGPAADSSRQQGGSSGLGNAHLQGCGRLQERRTVFLSCRSR